LMLLSYFYAGVPCLLKLVAIGLLVSTHINEETSDSLEFTERSLNQ